MPVLSRNFDAEEGQVGGETGGLADRRDATRMYDYYDDEIPVFGARNARAELGNSEIWKFGDSEIREFGNSGIQEFGRPGNFSLGNSDFGAPPAFFRSEEVGP